MKEEEFLWKFDDIIKKLDELEWTSLRRLDDDIGVIRWEVEALKNSVEEALHEKDVVIADLKKAIEIYKEAL